MSKSIGMDDTLAQMLRSGGLSRPRPARSRWRFSLRLVAFSPTFSSNCVDYLLSSSRRRLSAPAARVVVRVGSGLKTKYLVLIRLKSLMASAPWAPPYHH